MNRTILHHGPRATLRRSGFTLLELLAVIGIIVLLAALVTGASVAVLRGQKIRVTENILYTLDRALDEYYAVHNSIPPYIADNYDQIPWTDNPLVNYDCGAGNTMHSDRPDAKLFLFHARGFGEVDAILAGIPPQFLIRTPRGRTEPIDEVPSVLDSWSDNTWPVNDGGGSPTYPIASEQIIYFVHPRNCLAQAIYGPCINDRPYFMSAGPDRYYGHPSELGVVGLPASDSDEKRESLRTLREDNLYSSPIDRNFRIPGSALGLY